jgi:hypothetical protein
VSTTAILARPVEQAALFNPAFMSVLVHDVSKDHVEKAGVGLPVVLAFLAVPLVLHRPSRDALPATVASQMSEWVRAHPDLLLGLPSRARSLRDLVSAGICFGLKYQVLGGEDNRITPETLKRRPRNMQRTSETDACRAKAAFLGRWFAGQGDSPTLLAMWGLRA